MSNEVFPTFIGLKWNQQRTPIFSTRIQRAVSGREYRAGFFVYPLYQYSLSYDLLRDDVGHNELKGLVGFYLRHAGALDSFLYVDNADSNVSNQAIATGNGAANNFQLIRTYGNFTEPIPDANNSPSPVVYLDGNSQNSNNYSISYLNSGTLAFVSPPGNGVIISASFSYYHRVRFDEWQEGAGDLSQFMYRLWELKKLTMISAR